MKGLLRFLFGYVRIRLGIQKREDCLNLLHSHNINFWGYSEADDIFTLSTTKQGGALIRAQDAFEGAGFQNVGLGASAWHRRFRVGLLCGALASALIFLSFSSFVWDVRVEGNERLSEREILSELAAAGLSVGVPIRSLDTKGMAANLTLASHDLSFVRINLKGTVAYVTVRERDKTPEKTEKGFVNLVARTDATVSSLFVSYGSVLVHSGQVVRAGDILVSGITEGLEGSKLGCAEGEVFGRVTRVFSVTVPSEIAVSEEKYSKIGDFSFLFFGKTINIYRNTNNLPDNYATIYHSDDFYLFDSLKLPFGIRYSVLCAYSEGMHPLSASEQVSLAYLRLQEQMTLSLQGAELLSKTVTGSFGDGGYTLTCTVETLENIAVAQEFSAN